MGDEAVAVVRHGTGNLHAARLELCYSLFDVVAVEGDVGGAIGCRHRVRLTGGVHAHVRLWEVEDEPALPHVRVGEAELVAKESAERLRLGAVEHRVDAADHLGSPCWTDGNVN